MRGLVVCLTCLSFAALFVGRCLSFAPGRQSRREDLDNSTADQVLAPRNSKPGGDLGGRDGDAVPQEAVATRSRSQRNRHRRRTQDDPGRHFLWRSMIPIFKFRSGVKDPDNSNRSGNGTTVPQKRRPAKRIGPKYHKARPFDTPLIECPVSKEGLERFPCPAPDRSGRYLCIEEESLCDGFVDCPGAHDEDKQHCMFYRTTKQHMDVLADALLRWAGNKHY